MRFLLIRRADKNTETGVMPSEELLGAMAKYNEELIKAGVMVDGMGLHPSSAGAQIRFSNGTPMVVDGPFAEAKELIAGFTILNVNSKEEAIKWAMRWPSTDGDGNVQLELRRVFELEDFAPSEALEHHRRLGDELAAKSTK